MKKLGSLIVLFIIIFSSCSTENDENLSSSTIADLKATLLKEVQTSPQFSEFSITADTYFSGQTKSVFEAITESELSQHRKELFSDLTNSEKQNFWEYKLYNLIVENDFNKAQVSHISQLMEIITSSTFDLRNSNVNDVFENEWTRKAENLFTKDEVFLVAYSLVSFNRSIGPSVTIGSGGGNDCICLQESRYTCARITGVTTSGLDFEYGDCHDSSCETSTSGCGFLALYSCDGAECDFD